ncbi:MAG: PAS domain-containing sensor histidine kinase [Candidatus Sumerlaeia bacterium]|nr:PAS domain-containing sensor histidine kinase [Candidatus Sumerlaeia bacterium]
MSEPQELLGNAMRSERSEPAAPPPWYDRVKPLHDHSEILRSVVGSLSPAVREGLSLWQREHLDIHSLWMDALERANHILFVLDVRDHRFVYMSPNHERISGIPHETWMAMSFEQNIANIHSGDRERVAASLTSMHKRAVPHDVQSEVYEYRRVRPDGSVYWLREWGSCYYGPAAEPLVAAGTACDITTEKHRERELRDALALKNKCVGILVHDLRNPLTVIKGYTALLRDDMKISFEPHHLDMLARIERACDKLQSIVGDTLDFNAIEAGALALERVRMPVAEFLLRFRDLHAILGERKRIRIDAECSGEAGVGLFDPDHIEHVLENLLTNAIKYSNPGSRVVMRALPASAGMVWMEVEDEGLGIPQEERDRLFTEFGRCSVKPTDGEQSTGLGLAICRKVVAAHGGTIGCESEVGRGSVFRFSLPAAVLERSA